jgi:MoaA/NifB/PqqE/SkfB family radical SAM enzyme
MSNTPDRLRKSAVDFPMMIVVSTVYPCNFGCPNCPYSDGNSELRRFYSERHGDFFPVDLWESIATEAGPYGAWLRCTGGGEPLMHPHMVDMVEFAKERRCRVWMNTNGSLLGPSRAGRLRLRRLIECGIDLIEFSMDAGDAETYAHVRPPLKGSGGDLHDRWRRQVDNVRSALELRRELAQSTRIVVSMIRQKALDGKVEAAKSFWLNDVGVDEVILRKFLSWDDNTSIELGNSLDEDLYIEDWEKPPGPCVWPFERLNVDTLGRIALCGQDIGFRTSTLFPNAHDVSIQDIWRGKIFSEYRSLHLQGRGDEVFPCRGCSAWKAGIRDWNFGWIQVLESSAQSVKKVLEQDLGTEVEIFTPEP